MGKSALGRSSVHTLLFIPYYQTTLLKVQAKITHLAGVISMDTKRHESGGGKRQEWRPGGTSHRKWGSLTGWWIPIAYDQLSSSVILLEWGTHRAPSLCSTQSDGDRGHHWALLYIIPLWWHLAFISSFGLYNNCVNLILLSAFHSEKPEAPRKLLSVGKNEIHILEAK